MSVFSKLISKFPIKISAYDLQDRQVYYKANLVESRNTRNQKTQQKNSKWGLVLSDIKIHLKTSKIVSSNYHTIAVILHASKVMLKFLQARLQQYMNCELPGVQVGFRKGRRTRGKIANIFWIIKKAREFQKTTSISSLLTMQKPLTVWITINCGKIWKRWDYQINWPASWGTYMQVRKQQNWTWSNILVPNRKRSTSRLYIVTLLI